MHVSKLYTAHGRVSMASMSTGKTMEGGMIGLDGASLWFSRSHCGKDGSEALLLRLSAVR